MKIKSLMQIACNVNLYCVLCCILIDLNHQEGGENVSEKDAIRAAKNAYNREYYAKNRERIKENHNRYWLRKAAEMQQTEPQQESKQEE